MLITCAVCKRAVEKVEWREDFESRTLMIRAYCHGESQDMQVDLRSVTLRMLAALQHAQGEAFSECAGAVGIPRLPNVRLTGGPLDATNTPDAGGPSSAVAG